MEQCRMAKAANPGQKCFIYRNTELALEWMNSNRAVMNEAHAEMFLQYLLRRYVYNDCRSKCVHIVLTGPEQV